MNSMLAPRNTVKGDRVEFYILLQCCIDIAWMDYDRQKSQAIEL